MKQSRRELLRACTGAGAALCAGCVSQSPNGENGSDDDDTDDAAAGDGDRCDPIELARIDEPPHQPDRPTAPEDITDGTEWDATYLGAGMDDDSVVSFDTLDLDFHEPVVDVVEFDGDAVQYAELITSQETFDELVRPIGEASTDRVGEIDFENEAVIVVLTGFGSSAVRHEWVRVDDNCDEVHLHGYYERPSIQTDDYTTRVSGVVIKQPEEHDLERAWVSLTVGTDTRVNFHTEEGILGYSDDDSDEGGGEIDGHGAVDAVTAIPATRASEGDWYSDVREEIGVAVQLETEEELRSLVTQDEDVERFLDVTDFDTDVVFYLESAGPTACHRTDVTDVTIVAYDDGYFSQADAMVVDKQDEDQACAEVVTFPSVLIRVESEVDVQDGKFRLTDGWGEDTTIDAITVGELAQE